MSGADRAPEALIEHYGAADRERVGRLVAASRAAGTSRAYRSRLNDWRRWCEDRGLEPDEALSDKAIAAYIGDRHADGQAARTLGLAVAALRFACRTTGRGVADGPRTRYALQGARRLDAGAERPLPSLRREHVEDVIRGIEAEATEAEDGSSKALAATRDAAILAAAADAMLRISEVAALDVEDLAIEPDGSGRIRIRRSKTDQFGRGAVQYVPPATVARLAAWIEAAGIENGGPLWRGVSRWGKAGDARTAKRYIQRVIRERCEAAGFPGITCHALRRGTAESLTLSGAPLTEVMRAGRWRRAEMPLLYTQAVDAADGAIARFHGAARGAERAGG
ncbi:MAG: tyrosine-type recombinase/integrase [Chloroflexi bacterium]|nr:tyrosine-type recombinase/integrase [Chloroflexota bacterium]